MSFTTFYKDGNYAVHRQPVGADAAFSVLTMFPTDTDGFVNGQARQTVLPCERAARFGVGDEAFATMIDGAAGPLSSVAATARAKKPKDDGSTKELFKLLDQGLQVDPAEAAEAARRSASELQNATEAAIANSSAFQAAKDAGSDKKLPAGGDNRPKPEDLIHTDTFGDVNGTFGTINVVFSAVTLKDKFVIVPSRVMDITAINGVGTVIRTSTHAMEFEDFRKTVFKQILEQTSLSFGLALKLGLDAPPIPDNTNATKEGDQVFKDGKPEEPAKEEDKKAKDDQKAKDGTAGVQATPPLGGTFNLAFVKQKFELSLTNIQSFRFSHKPVHFDSQFFKPAGG